MFFVFNVKCFKFYKFLDMGKKLSDRCYIMHSAVSLQTGLIKHCRSFHFNSTCLGIWKIVHLWIQWSLGLLIRIHTYSVGGQAEDIWIYGVFLLPNRDTFRLARRVTFSAIVSSSSGCYCIRNQYHIHSRDGISRFMQICPFSSFRSCGPFY